MLLLPAPEPSLLLLPCQHPSVITVHFFNSDYCANPSLDDASSKKPSVILETRSGILSMSIYCICTYSSLLKLKFFPSFRAYHLESTNLSIFNCKNSA